MNELLDRLSKYSAVFLQNYNTSNEFDELFGELKESYTDHYSTLYLQSLINIYQYLSEKRSTALTSARELFSRFVKNFIQIQTNKDESSLVTLKKDILEYYQLKENVLRIENDRNKKYKLPQLSEKFDQLNAVMYSLEWNISASILETFEKTLSEFKAILKDSISAQFIGHFESLLKYMKTSGQAPHPDTLKVLSVIQQTFKSSMLESTTHEQAEAYLNECAESLRSFQEQTSIVFDNAYVQSNTKIKNSDIEEDAEVSSYISRFFTDDDEVEEFVDNTFHNVVKPSQQDNFSAEEDDEQTDLFGVAKQRAAAQVDYPDRVNQTQQESSYHEADPFARVMQETRQQSIQSQPMDELDSLRQFDDTENTTPQYEDNLQSLQTYNDESMHDENQLPEEIHESLAQEDQPSQKFDDSFEDQTKNELNAFFGDDLSSFPSSQQQFSDTSSFQSLGESEDEADGEETTQLAPYVEDAHNDAHEADFLSALDEAITEDNQPTQQTLSTEPTHVSEVEFQSELNESLSMFDDEGRLEEHSTSSSIQADFKHIEEVAADEETIEVDDIADYSMEDGELPPALSRSAKTKHSIVDESQNIEIDHPTALDFLGVDDEDAGRVDFEFSKDESVQDEEKTEERVVKRVAAVSDDESITEETADEETLDNSEKIDEENEKEVEETKQDELDVAQEDSTHKFVSAKSSTQPSDLTDLPRDASGRFISRKKAAELSATAAEEVKQATASSVEEEATDETAEQKPLQKKLLKRKKLSEREECVKSIEGAITDIFESETAETYLQNIKEALNINSIDILLRVILELLGDLKTASSGSADNSDVINLLKEALSKLEESD